MSTKIFKKESGESKKSKLQSRYEKLLKDIDKKKKQQQNLRDGLRTAVPRVITELQPLAKAETEWHIKKLIRLDEIVDEIVISKNKRDMFVDYILQELRMFLSTSHQSDETLKRLYRKYAKEDFQQNRFFNSFGSASAEDSSNDDIVEFSHENTKESTDNKTFNFQEEKESFGKKPKKLSKKEEIEAEEEKILAQDAKAIYFRLIKKYHPDRQQDPTKQKEYTEISKLVTKAYKDNDFMALLRLQVEYIDENENDAHALADDMIMRYNKILQNQLNELNSELTIAKMSSQGLFEDFFDQNYEFSEKLFEKKKREIEVNIAHIKANIEESERQKKGWFKQWIKELQELNNQRSMEFLFGGF
ncbi:hypothetical protein [Lacihabitans soyangensis]|uniref:J domain-containing protein n=1 Tax=Lacihabitans soyangensis TaxID=869394 RepID=A0AAE3H6M2_9BACT|nr:hypothetical protein [Lacihabitans soyangensis]MCP9763965.1 hypothetical protein [Lacihabitans soyangensis]